MKNLAGRISTWVLAIFGSGLIAFAVWTHDHAKALPGINQTMVKEVGYLLAKDIDSDRKHYESDKHCRDLKSDIRKLRIQRRDIIIKGGGDGLILEVEDEIKDAERELNRMEGIRSGYDKDRGDVIASLYRLTTSQ